jgi:hypothetical protein
MRWLKVLTAAVLATGCASGSPSSDRGPEIPTRIISGSSTSADIILEDQRYAVGRDFGATAPELFEATVAAYAELGIEITEMEVDRRVGNRRFQARRRLAGERLTKYLRCGVDVTGRALADSGIAVIDVVSEIVPLSDLDSRLETTVAASARKAGGTSTDPVLCTSRGGLEERIADLVAQRLP